MKKVERRYFTTDEKTIILQKTDGVCARCGKKLAIDSMTVDHIFPIDKGGLHDEYNMLPLCEDCNSIKSNYVYNFEHFYKHVREEEKDKFITYNNFATFDYSRKSIIGYDEVVFRFVPCEHMKIIAAMKKRHAKIQKINEAYDRLKVSVILRKAFPGDAEKIFAVMQKTKGSYRELNHIYKSEYDVLDDIRADCMYILENHDSICGVFAFRPVQCLDVDICTAQLQNVIEEIGLELKYIMTFATTTPYAMFALDEIMRYFESCQLENGWMPIYFGIIDRMYVEKKSCIIMPYVINGVQSTLEFMPLKHLYDKRRELTVELFADNGYEDVPDEDIDTCTDLTLKYSILKDAMEARGGSEFFVKYPKIEQYFRPESFELYDVGFLTKLANGKGK